MKGGSVESRAAAVGAVTGATTVLSIVFQLISVPVCLYFWGETLYGEWLAVFAAATMLRTVDGGFVTYVGNRLNLEFHGDPGELRRTLASSIFGVLLLGLVQIGLALAAIFFGGLEWLFGASGVEAIDAAPVAIVILVVTWVLSGSYIGILHRLLIPTGFMYESAWWSMGYQSSVFVGIIGAAALRLDLIGTSLLLAGIQAVVYVSSAIYIRFKLPEFAPWIRNPEWKIGLRDLVGSTIFTFSGALQQIATNGMMLFVAGTFGAASVPVFTTIRTLANLWTNVTNTLSSPLLPDVIRYHATGQREKLVALLDAHAWLLTGVVNFGAVATYPVLVFMYGYWTGGQLVFDPTLAAALLAAVMFTNAVGLTNVYLVGANDTLTILTTAVVRAVVSIGVATATMKLGLLSAGLGIASAEAACMLLMLFVLTPRLLRRSGDGKGGVRFRWAMLSTLAATVFFAAVGWRGHATTLDVSVTLLLVLVFAVLGWRGLGRDVKARLVILAARILRIRSVTGG